MKKIILNVLKFVMFLGTPFTLLSAIWLKFVKKSGLNSINDQIFMKVGVLPVLDQYYQPMINPEKHLIKSLRLDRDLPGIDFNEDEQIDLLSKFNYNEELLKFPQEKTQKLEYFYNNGSYESGDSEYLYNIVRHFKPKNIIEIGSGNSTLMVKNALGQNKIENINYNCNHICIEPYEMPWLKEIDVELVRDKVECVDKSIFQKLEENDILFIDSSHIIRPQGDVLFEFLEILPTLKYGVIIHVHDIFSPKDYLNEWIFKHHFLWNEQYLLEAFLSFNNDFKIIGALNFLKHNHLEEFIAKCPIFATQQDREPGSFWLMRK